MHAACVSHAGLVPLLWDTDLMRVLDAAETTTTLYKLFRSLCWHSGIVAQVNKQVQLALGAQTWDEARQFASIAQEPADACTVPLIEFAVNMLAQGPAQSYSRIEL